VSAAYKRGDRAIAGPVVSADESRCASRRGWLVRCAAAALPSLAAVTLPSLAADARPPREGAALSARAWLNTHPTIRFAPEAAYGPFVFVRPDGAVAGLSVDLLAALANQVGMHFSTLAAQPLSQILDDVQAHRADLVSSLRPTPQRSVFLRFTQPYIEVPAVLAVRKDQRTPLKALSGRPVGVGQGYAVEAFVRQRHPAVAWVPFADDEAALRALAAGALDATVLDVASLAHATQQLGIDSIVVSESVAFKYPLSFAVREDWPDLVNILDDGLVSLKRSERDRIIERWLGPFAQTLSAPLSSGTIWGSSLLAAGAGAAAWAVFSRRRTPAHLGRLSRAEESQW
jgi:ABC-type amino acid transport substrate-binding protein